MLTPLPSFSPPPRPSLHRLTHVLPLLLLATIVPLANAEPLIAPVPHEPPPMNAQPKPLTLPITRLTLYRSGVASIERTRTIDGSRFTVLTLRQNQINDILKSLVVLDASGQVGTVGFASQQPLERRLAALGIDISDNPDLTTLLTRLRGVSVRVKTADADISGTILNVERRTTVIRATPGGNPGHPELPWLNVLTDAGVRLINLADVVSVDILDPKLAKDLKDALAIVAGQRSDDMRNVEIGFPDAPERPVTVAYVMEAPIWKTSYRLVLPDNSTNQLLLQGWAIVENMSDEPWHGVRLALASGQPSAFQMNLYEPLYSQRPWVPVPVPATLVARAMEEGILSVIDVAADMENVPGLARSAEAARPAAPAAGRNMIGNGGSRGGVALTKMAAVTAAAAGMQTGDVFFYEIETPVSLASQQSAMLPIVSRQIPGRRVSVYQAGTGPSTNPLRAVELTNESGLQLIAGPVAIYDEGVYAGDAQMNDVGKGEKRLLTYALDQEIKVLRDEAWGGDVERVRIEQGNFIVSRQQRRTLEYTIVSTDQTSARSLIIEEPALDGYDLVEPDRPLEVTAATLRFGVEVAPKARAMLRIVQRRIVAESLGMMSISPAQFASYATTGAVSDAVKAKYAEAQRLNREAQDAQQRAAALRAERDEITKEQERIRQNLASVDRTTDLGQRLIAKLTGQESRFDELASLIRTSDADSQAKAKALQDFLSQLTVD